MRVVRTDDGVWVVLDWIVAVAVEDRQYVGFCAVAQPLMGEPIVLRSFQGASRGAYQEGDHERVKRGVAKAEAWAAEFVKQLEGVSPVFVNATLDA